MDSVKKLVEFTPLLYIDKLYNTHLGIWIQYELDKKGENKKIPYISVSLGFGKPSEFGNTFEFFEFNALDISFFKRENKFSIDIRSEKHYNSTSTYLYKKSLEEVKDIITKDKTFFTRIFKALQTSSSIFEFYDNYLKASESDYLKEYTRRLDSRMNFIEGIITTFDLFNSIFKELLRNKTLYDWPDIYEFAFKVRDKIGEDKLFKEEVPELIEFFDFLGNVLKEKYYKNENNIRNEVQQIRKKEINVLLELLPEKTITTLFEKIC